MRRPWFEAGPALAAAGFSLTTAATRGSAWKHPMVDTALYAFLPRLDAVTKPFVFADIQGLARHIDRNSLGQALQLEEVEDLQFAGVEGLHRGVQVWRLDISNDREASQGYAWLKGRGRDVLDPAMREARRRSQRNDAADRRAA
ncbi:MAG: hypothetical protein DCF29_03740 [Alphaproteobacteria bacterium]|nr:MAG: hypothetical protein DCF29_03740 [Alphaproteobacteria bacterium]